MSDTQTQHLRRVRVDVRGVVQGVGFRPFVFNLAEQLGLSGWVLNHSGGVEIQVEGNSKTLQAFVVALSEQAPPLACIESLEIQDLPPRGDARFEIRRSESQSDRYQPVSPDVATCPDCLRELFDPDNRRYHYPFINCTHCGPRFTIISDLPYDRPNTTMRRFAMCPDCQREYDDPRDRRFHAQPNACAICGPRLELVHGQDGIRNREDGIRGREGRLGDAQLGACHNADSLACSITLLRQGAILAIKGLGGFQLACDAANADAVQTLRQRKHRPHKPFAVMMVDLDEIKQHCQVSLEEEMLLLSPQRPIVLLPWRDDSSVVRNVAPNQRTLGVMLPYTPLHHLLLHDFGGPLVMTSGNRGEEPIAADNDEAMQRLGDLADAFLLHDRPIAARYDDSVWFAPDAGPQPIRRARGYAPLPIRLPFDGPSILAVGGEIKNTFCFTRDRDAFLSPHIGDMENLETLEHFQRTVELYQHLFRIEPQVIACDLHPDYLSTRHARELAAIRNLPFVPVQHHHAHLAACLADNGWTPEQGAVIGAIMDGSGYGDDGHIWGGEWLIGGYDGYRRAAHLGYLPLPGGDAATRQPWRIAAGYVYTLLGQMPRGIAPDHVEMAWLQQQLDRRINSPLTSSMGRLFDAVSALLGVCAEISYEAQAAVELEQVAKCQGAINPVYPFEIKEGRVVCLSKMLSAILGDIERKLSVSEIAWRFHCTIARIIVQVCEQVVVESGLRVVALSGGCFQNRLLLDLVTPQLQQNGFRVLLHHHVPANDGGLSLGQAAVSRWMARGRQERAEKHQDTKHF